jgi:hypothetical protein
MGGTGLEPVTPSLSTRSSVRVSSLTFAKGAWLSAIWQRANARANANERRALPLLPRGVLDRVHVYGFRVYPDAVMKASASAR